MIRDDVLSSGLQSAGSAMIALAFEVYGISDPPLYDITAKGYIDEVVERRHAVAHGRESPVAAGILKVVELRRRYDALYDQSIYVIDIINKFCTTKEYVLPRYTVTSSDHPRDMGKLTCGTNLILAFVSGPTSR